MKRLGRSIDEVYIHAVVIEIGKESESNGHDLGHESEQTVRNGVQGGVSIQQRWLSSE